MFFGNFQPSAPLPFLIFINYLFQGKRRDRKDIRAILPRIGEDCQAESDRAEPAEADPRYLLQTLPSQVVRL